jgi:hypothetical protein
VGAPVIVKVVAVVPNAAPPWQPVQLVSPGALVRWVGGTLLDEFVSVTDAKSMAHNVHTNKNKVFFIVN